MSNFNEMKKEDLVAVAEKFGVEINVHETKAVIIGHLVAEGVTPELVASFEPGETPVVEDDAPVAPKFSPNEDPGEKVTVRMKRSNASFEARGYRFTREHPFALVDEDDAEYLINTLGGFQLATQTEIQKYYG